MEEQIDPRPVALLGLSIGLNLSGMPDVLLQHERSSLRVGRFSRFGVGSVRDVM